MSTRQLKKLQQAKLSQEDSEHSDNEYEPPYVNRLSKSSFKDLILSSSSDEEADSGGTLSEKERQAPDEKEEWVIDESSNPDSGNATQGPQSSGPSGSGIKNIESKKKKKSEKYQRAQSSARNIAFDEVEQSLLEVNAMLGEPAKQEFAGCSEKKADERTRLFSIKWKHINSVYEPSKETEDLPRRKGRRPNFNRINKYKIIQKDFTFQKLGLSMSIVHRDSEKINFKFNRTKEYQKFHSMFEFSSKSDINPSIEMSLKHMHVESLIVASDELFRLEDFDTACELIERAIAYMQYTALPSFNSFDLGTRLDYKDRENRAFHIMLLKYIYLLTNRACHRAAMELAKVLLNLDETDPLGVLFIIDVLALRAKEYKWLLDAIAFLEEEHKLECMFNLQFSKALARFLTSHPDSAERETSDRYIQQALRSYPLLLQQILHYTKYGHHSVLKLDLFGDFPHTTGRPILRDVLGLYASLTAQQWRDPSVMEWLIRNAETLGQIYPEDNVLEEAARADGEKKISLFKSWPDNLRRHLITINAMGGLLDGIALPPATSNRVYDPVAPITKVGISGRRSSHFRTFLSSLPVPIDIPSGDDDSDDSEVDSEASQFKIVHLTFFR